MAVPASSAAAHLAPGMRPYHVTVDLRHFQANHFISHGHGYLPDE